MKIVELEQPYIYYEMDTAGQIFGISTLKTGYFAHQSCNYLSKNSDIMKYYSLK